MSFARSGRRLGAAIGSMLLLGLLTFAQWLTANPPLQFPTTWDAVLPWLSAAPNSGFNITALLTALGAAAAIQQMFFAPEAATSKLVTDEATNTRARIDQASAAQLKAIREEKVAATIAAVNDGSTSANNLKR